MRPGNRNKIPRYCCEEYHDVKWHKATNGYSQENFIANFQFGKVYRGIFKGEEVIVKKYEEDNGVLPGDNHSRVVDEFRFLEQYVTEDPHPNIAKAVGCSAEGTMAIVHELKALDTLHNLLVNDGLSWPQRIKVALGIASALQFMHCVQAPFTAPYLVRNICAAHIMLDEDYSPVLYDFSMISGGILTDKRDLVNQYVIGNHGYVDPVSARTGTWSEKCDVFSFGVLLLELISGKVYTEEDHNCGTPFIYEWAWSEYKQQKRKWGNPKFTLVNKIFESDKLFYSRDGRELTKLAMKCVEYDPLKRPTMKQIVRYLLNLQIVPNHRNYLGIERELYAHQANPPRKILPGFAKLMLKRSDFQHMCSYLSRKYRLLHSPKGFRAQIRGKSLKRCPRHFSQFIRGKQSLLNKQRSRNFSKAEEYNMIQAFSYEKLSMLTNGWDYQFGKMFRGELDGKFVTVKTWDIPPKVRVRQFETETRLRDEIVLLHQYPKFKSHPNLVKLIGYCHEGERLGVVYDLNPVDTVYNLLPKDSFTWLLRIKVALGFAFLLEFLHSSDPTRLPFLVRNIDAAHIMVDQNGLPKLLDFGMFTGGILPDRRYYRHQFLHYLPFGYMDWSNYTDGTGLGAVESDVFGYGIVLFCLITKYFYMDKRYDGKSLHISDWVEREYKAKSLSTGSSRSKCSFVHPSLEVERGFCGCDGLELTKLATQCVDLDPSVRPTVRQVIKQLCKLHVVRNYADELGINEMLL
ncbi:hypothetical protein Tsubulata_035783 [Turnera subulata]|uniref:Protein kinase domain-containing protein n=1 Tax=Turnera subulata TaxID=218843 RepID=A0A9Q0FUI2_9ROSI|nr:hypothetical protein Tsubulata_035783 [Turnera subulata]